MATAESAAKAWAEACLQAPLEEGPLVEVLHDGTVLCDVLNKCWPDSVRKVYRGPVAFRQMENVTMFIKAARNIGVPSRHLFDTVDLFERGNTKAVADTMLYLRELAIEDGVFNEDASAPAFGQSRRRAKSAVQRGPPRPLPPPRVDPKKGFSILNMGGYRMEGYTHLAGAHQPKSSRRRSSRFNFRRLVSRPSPFHDDGRSPADRGSDQAATAAAAPQQLESAPSSSSFTAAPRGIARRVSGIAATAKRLSVRSRRSDGSFRQEDDLKASAQALQIHPGVDDAIYEEDHSDDDDEDVRDDDDLHDDEDSATEDDDESDRGSDDEQNGSEADLDEEERAALDLDDRGRDIEGASDADSVREDEEDDGEEMDDVEDERTLYGVEPEDVYLGRSAFEDEDEDEQSEDEGNDDESKPYGAEAEDVLASEDEDEEDEERERANAKNADVRIGRFISESRDDLRDAAGGEQAAFRSSQRTTVSSASSDVRSGAEREEVPDLAVFTEGPAKRKSLFKKLVTMTRPEARQERYEVHKQEETRGEEEQRREEELRRERARSKYSTESAPRVRSRKSLSKYLANIFGRSSRR